MWDARDANPTPPPPISSIYTFSPPPISPSSNTFSPTIIPPPTLFPPPPTIPTRKCATTNLTERYVCHTLHFCSSKADLDRICHVVFQRTFDQLKCIIPWSELTKLRCWRFASWSYSSILNEQKASIRLLLINYNCSNSRVMKRPPFPVTWGTTCWILLPCTSFLMCHNNRQELIGILYALLTQYKLEQSKEGK